MRLRLYIILQIFRF